jgi:hypothetical protein
MAGSVTFILKEPIIDYKGNPKKYPKEKRSEIIKENTRRSKLETPIFLIYRYKQDRIKLSTGEKIKPKYWNSKDRQAKEIKPLKTELENLNARLSNIKTGVMNTARDHINKNGRVILDELTEEFRPILKPGAIKTAKKHTFLTAIQEYIDTTNKKPATIGSYKTTKKELKEYQNTIKKELYLEDIDLDFYEGFMNWRIRSN